MTNRFTYGIITMIMYGAGKPPVYCFILASLRILPQGSGKDDKMNYEKSCGAIVYRKFHGNTEILLVRHIKSGHWSFPKGHIEDGETEEETAKREIKEETGVDVLLDTGFRETVSYSPKRNTKKTVVYFVGMATSHELIPQKEEISDLKWQEIGQAAGTLTYDNDKAIVNKAKAFIALMK